jgi:LysR family nitrogen assimilation transcriptional regulator
MHNCHIIHAQNRWITQSGAAVDLKQLRYFVHAAQTRSLTAASTHAYVTQSALSRQIKLLEDELGVELFERQARGVKLTEAGVVLLARAIALLHDAEEIKGAIGAVSHEPTGPLRLGLQPSLRSMLVAPAIARFHRDFPKVRFLIREGTSRAMRDALGAGETDIVTVSSLETLDPFTVHPLVSEALCWVGPPQAKLNVDRPVDIRALTTKPLILTAYPNSLRAIVGNALAKRGLTVEPVMEVDMASIMIDLIRQGVGYTVLPYGAVHDALMAGYISVCPIRDLRIGWVIAVSRERVQTTASLRAVQCLKDVCAEALSHGSWKTARKA